jgi:hypothetical protein
LMLREGRAKVVEVGEGLELWGIAVLEILRLNWQIKRIIDLFI